MIIKTPIQELIFVLDFFNKVYANDPTMLAIEFTKYFAKTLDALEYTEKYLIIDSFDAGADVTFFSIKIDGAKYFLENFNNE